jgi:hypothetical protein
MGTSLQATTAFGIQDWQAFYTSMGSPNLASYDFSTLRKSFINYLQLKNPENFNDYIESSEFTALIDLIAFMGQSMSFRYDMNARENFLPTAQSRNSINYLANLVNYIPSRNLAANGYLKINSLSVNDNVYDSLGNNLNGITINWNDRTNRNWQDQWNTIINAVLISSQTIGNPGNTNVINGINYSEYGLSSSAGQAPPYAFTASINSSSTNFEIVNPTSVGETFIYEIDPEHTSTFNLLYENDGLGFASQNTGYFLYFKQGTLSSQTFSIASGLPNTSINLSQTGVNNSDVWLYQLNTDGTITEWTQVQTIYGENTAFNNLPSQQQTIFSVTNQINDAITLIFGDGVFGAIPQGNFICFTRSSNGLTYRINPSEMSNLSFPINYTSKTNRTQLLTINASLQYTVGNSAGTESLANIKLKAPQSFYSQNRMVNGQDYNSFPFTKYSNILQLKAINRTASGVSRYLDVIDPTGKFSSTNVFCDDGFIYTDPSVITNNYTYANQNNLATIVESQITSLISSNNTLSFVLNPSNYPITIPSAATAWNLVLTDNTSSSGWISDVATGNLITINDGRFAPVSHSSILKIGSLLQFTAPTGQFFDINNNLITSSSQLLNQKSIIYAAITSADSAGIGNSISMNGINVDGSGAILLSQKIPTGALLTGILPLYIPVLPSNLIQKLITYLTNGNAVALSYNSYTLSWSLDNTLPLNFSPAIYGSQFIAPMSPAAINTNDWLLAFVPTSTTTFTVYQQSNAYYFGSEQQTTFYFDPNAKVYDPTNASTLTDQIIILETNSAPGVAVNLGLPNDISVDVYAVVDEINGLIDNSRVQIQYAGLAYTGIPTDPFFFKDCVSDSNFIFLVTDNSQSTTKLISSGANQVVVVNLPTDINNNLYSYANGAIIFCLSTLQFYQISRVGSLATKTTLNQPGSTLTYSYYVGRQNLKFQYQHNASDNRRIDPSPSNIIDMYCLESSYATAYQQYITDQTGQIALPTPPTTETLSNDFNDLNNYKMVSDELIFNSAQFVPLFGDKADPSVQATFVAVANPNSAVGAGEIASQIITLVNNFFTIGNFNFGQTFFWAQLSNYILSNMTNIINAVHLVPNAGNLSYGALEQIVCNPYEIFISAATVKNISVVTSLNNLNLRIS